MTKHPPAPTEQPKEGKGVKFWGWIATLIGGIVLAVVVALLLNPPTTGPIHDIYVKVIPPDAPITVNVAHGPRCTRVSPASNVEVDGDESTVVMTVQGKSESAVVLTGMRVIVDKRSKPAGSVMFCGGIEPVREFTVDLDQTTTSVVAQAGRDDHGAPTPPVSFPFTVSAKDPEVLRLTAWTQTCDCTWRIELSWTAGGRSGTYPVDDNGSQFRTIGTRGITG